MFSVFAMGTPIQIPPRHKSFLSPTWRELQNISDSVAVSRTSAFTNTKQSDATNTVGGLVEDTSSNVATTKSTDGLGLENHCLHIVLLQGFQESVSEKIMFFFPPNFQ